MQLRTAVLAAIHHPVQATLVEATPVGRVLPTAQVSELLQQALWDLVVRVQLARLALGPVLAWEERVL